MSKSRQFSVKAQRSAIKSIQPEPEEEILQENVGEQPLTSVYDLLSKLLPDYVDSEIEALTKAKLIENLPIRALVEIVGFLRSASETPEKRSNAVMFLSQMQSFDQWQLPNMEDHEKEYRRNIDLEFARAGGTILKNRICPKCRGNEFNVTEVQRASADEAGFEFFACTRCVNV